MGTMVEPRLIDLDQVRVHPVERHQEPLHRQRMAAHHYLGYLPKIGHTLWYVATYYGQWVGLLIFSAAAWKCAVRDRWIGWDFHHQYDYDRLKLIANNSRFLILPHWHRPNLASKILSLCQKRLANDWQKCFGHRLLLLETFVDPRFHGTVYRAANWTYLGLTRGYRRTRQGYRLTEKSVRQIFAKQCSHTAGLSRAAIALSSRSTQNDVERSTNAIVAGLLSRHSRSAPRPRTAPLPAHRVGHRVWGDSVRHARLQSDSGLGAKPRSQSQREIPLPKGQRTVVGAQRIDHS